MTPTLTVVGLGPGDPMLLTRAAWDCLVHAPLIVTPTPAHPALAAFAERTQPSSLDDMTDTLNALVQHGALCVALSGNPHDGPSDMLAALRRLQQDTPFTLHVIAGVSLLQGFYTALEQLTASTLRPATYGTQGSTPADSIQMITLHELARFAGAPLEPASIAGNVRPWIESQQQGTYSPPQASYLVQPVCPVLIWAGGRSLESSTWALIQRRLMPLYPAHHPVVLVRLGMMGEPVAAATSALAALTEQPPFDERTALYLPALAVAEDYRSVAGLQYIVTRLLGPDGCPWDVRQTHQDLRGALLEETYEVLEALDAGDKAALKEELGDLVMQVFSHSEMARQAGAFDIGDVLESITCKLIRRHPHVFGERTVDDIGEVVQNWEQIKAQELQAKGRARSSALDGVPRDLPALAAAQKVGKKAARATFDHPTLERIWEKFAEEVDELQAAYVADVQQPTHASRTHLAEELGDMLYAAAQLARWLDLDAESVLREAIAKFRKRFVRVEQMVAAEGRTLSELTTAEKGALWAQAKEQGD
ncbi:MAG: nucleoside triphosphate pyrophosphohydrolase [Chloroflexaceae bacterium]|nr:nucleoside triphosphate pyrophosphohydrolase [Chloroflexaceae bacterium]